jgi:hypothetical protein
MRRWGAAPPHPQRTGSAEPASVAVAVHVVEVFATKLCRRASASRHSTIDDSVTQRERQIRLRGS